MPSPTTATPSTSTSSHNVVGVHYKVGKKIGEGSFGVIYEGKNKHAGAMLLPPIVIFLTSHYTSVTFAIALHIIWYSRNKSSQQSASGHQIRTS